MAWCAGLAAAMLASAGLAAIVNSDEWTGMNPGWNTYVSAATYGTIALTVLGAAHRIMSVSRVR